jgi:hypothetical protein
MENSEWKMESRGLKGHYLLTTIHSRFNELHFLQISTLVNHSFSDNHLPLL